MTHTSQVHRDKGLKVRRIPKKSIVQRVGTEYVSGGYVPSVSTLLKFGSGYDRTGETRSFSEVEPHKRVVGHLGQGGGLSIKFRN